MSKTNKSRVRRRNYRWTKKEIDYLINWRLVDFLPEGYAENETLPSAKRSQILKLIKPLFAPERIRELEREAKVIKQQGLDRSECEQAILKAAMRVTSPSPDILGVNRAATYIQVSLGLRTSLSGMGIEAAKLTDHRWLRRQSLLKIEQRIYFLSRTGVNGDLWISPAWRECLTMRYEKNDPPAIALLSTTKRRILDREARRLREEVSTDDVTEEQLDQALTKAGLTRSIGEALQLVLVEYLRARLGGPISSDHMLKKPISQSGLFQRIAASAAECEASSKRTQQSYVKRFLRYLRIPPGHADDLVGKILYEVLRLESDLCDHPKVKPPAFAGIRWPARLKPEIMRITRNFTPVADQFASALQIDRQVFTDILQVYTKLVLRNFWAKQASVDLTVFWAARLLEGCKPEVYRIYGRLIDFFHRDGIRPLVKEEQSGSADGPTRRATLAPFIYALINDPLLNCVFHSEVFDGRDRLFPRTQKLREDNLVRSQIIAYTVHRLRQERPETPTVKVADVLPEGMGLPAHLRHSATPSTRDPVERIQGFSHFAYAAVLATALVNDPEWTTTADNVRDTFHHHKDDAEVRRLLVGPDQQDDSPSVAKVNK